MWESFFLHKSVNESTAATGFGAAVAETGREFSSRGSGHVEIGLEVEFLRLALLQNKKKDASNTTIILFCMNFL